MRYMLKVQSAGKTVQNLSGVRILGWRVKRLTGKYAFWGDIRLPETRL